LRLIVTKNYHYQKQYLFLNLLIGFGGSYLFSDALKIGGTYQHFDDNYVNETMGWDGYSISNYNHSIRNIYEVHGVLMRNKKNKKTSFGIGIKPGIQYHFGKNFIISKSHNFINTTKLDTTQIRELHFYNSGIFYTRFNNILNSNFSFEINVQIGAVLFGIYSQNLYSNPFAIFTPFSRLNAGLIYNFKNKSKNKKTL